MAILDDSLLCLSKFSTAGLQQLAGIQGDTKAKAIFWVSVFIGSLVLLGVQVNSLVVKLNTYPTNVAIEITDGPLVFPTVTFCSLGMLKKSIVRKIPVFKTMEQLYGTKSAKRKKRQTSDVADRKTIGNDSTILANSTDRHWSDQLSTPKETENTDLTPHVENLNPVPASVQQPRCDNESTIRSDSIWFWHRNTPQPFVEDGFSSEVSNRQANEFATTGQKESKPAESSALTEPSSEGHKTVSKVWSEPIGSLKDLSPIRRKRSLAGNACYGPAYDSSGWFMSCANSAIELTSAPTKYMTAPVCLAYCITVNAVSYRNNEMGSCACYSGDCCSSTAPISPDNAVPFNGGYLNYIVSSIGQCDDVFLDVPYGSNTGDSFPYVETNVVIHTCAPNAITARKTTTETYTCQKTGVWLPIFAPCIPGCSSLASGSIILPSLISSGSSYTYKCPSGWFTAGLVQSVVYLCSNGVWNQIFQPCYPVCPTVFDTSGVVSPLPPFVSVPKTFTFTCNSKWLTANLLSTESYTCSSDGTWNKPFQKCYAVCSNIFDSTGSVWPLAPFVGIPKSYIFTCKSNWLTVNLRSTESYTCSGSSGNWDRSFQQCYAVCPNIFDTTGVASPPSPYMGFPKSYTFTCLLGYLLLNYNKTQQYTCKTDGIWNPFALTPCIEECLMIIRPQIVMQLAYNGPIIDNLIPSGHSGTFSCAANYNLFGLTTATKCTSGSWDKTPIQYPQCLENCDPFDPSVLFERLNVIYSRTIPLINGTVASFSCNDSFHMYGDYPITTCSNGTWDVDDVDLPICLEQQVANYDAKTLESYVGNYMGKDTLSDATVLAAMIPFIIANLSDSMKASMGFQDYDNLISCTYGPRVCDKSFEIKGFMDNSMGNCYSFNHKYQNQSLVADRAGEQSGLWWILNTKQEEFMSIIPTSGFQLMIHQQFDPLFPNSMGIHVSPGFNYIVGLRRKTEQRLETPVSVCYSDTRRAQYYYVANVSYANEACERSYYQSQVIDGCGCGTPNLPCTNCDSPLCLIENMTCVNNHLNTDNISNKKDLLLQYCPAACSNLDEQPVVTITATAQNSVLYNTKKYSNAYQQSNFVSIKVFFETLEVIHFKEKLSYEILDFISDFASATGSMIGMSCISLVEVIVILVQLVSYPVRKIIGAA